MPASDILKGLLAFGTGGLTGYAGAKEKNRERDFKQQIKDMELQVRMENIRRMTAEDQWQAERADFQNRLSAAQTKQTTDLTQPKVDLTNAQVGLTDARADHIPVAEKLAEVLGQSLVSDRKARDDDRDAAREDRKQLMELFFGTKDNPGGIKTDAEGKVTSGKTAAAKTPYHVKLEIKELSEAREPWLRAYGKTLEDHPEVYEQVIEAAASYAADDPDNKNKNMKMAQLKRSKYYEQAIEDAKEAIAAAKSTEVAAPPPLRPDFMRFQQMLTGPQAP